MSEKKLTISNRWREWAEKEPIWAYTTLASFIISILGLGLHLAVLHGLWRTVGLWVLILCGAWTQTALFLRKRWWWFTFHAYIVLGVIGWELASYFFG